MDVYLRELKMLCIFNIYSINTRTKPVDQLIGLLLLFKCFSILSH